MNQCTHDFFEVSKIVNETNTDIYGAKVICAYCGHMRKLWNDGIVELVNDKGMVKHVPYANDPNSTAKG